MSWLFYLSYDLAGIDERARAGLCWRRLPNPPLRPCVLTERWHECDSLRPTSRRSWPTPLVPINRYETMPRFSEKTFISVYTPDALNLRTRFSYTFVDVPTYIYRRDMQFFIFIYIRSVYIWYLLTYTYDTYIQRFRNVSYRNIRSGTIVNSQLFKSPWPSFV